MSAAAVAVEAEPASGSSETHFVFASKVFAVPGAHFAIAPDGRPALFVKLGELRAAISFASLKAEFGIAEDDGDGRLLTLVEQALGFVKQVRPGDSIPSELLDGTASWTVEERHHLIARGRLASQLASWLAGDQTDETEASKLMDIAEDPGVKERVQRAFDELAEKLGLGRERRQEVVDKVDGFARELAYIEGLRERYGEVQAIARKSREMIAACKRDRALQDSLDRIRALIQAPLAEFDNVFSLIEAQTCEIMTVLRKYPEQVEFVRRQRDDLRRRLVRWDELIELWKAPHGDEPDKIDRLVRAAYGFLARNYSQSSRWVSRG